MNLEDAPALCHYLRRERLAQECISRPQARWLISNGADAASFSARLMLGCWNVKSSTQVHHEGHPSP